MGSLTLKAVAAVSAIVDAQGEPPIVRTHAGEVRGVGHVTGLSRVLALVVRVGFGVRLGSDPIGDAGVGDRPVEGRVKLLQDRRRARAVGRATVADLRDVARAL